MGEELRYFFIQWVESNSAPEFKLEYTNNLGQSFASATSGFKENDPARNLKVLVNAVDRELRDIQKRGEKDHPLWDVQGVSLFQTTTHYNIS